MNWAQPWWLALWLAVAGLAAVVAGAGWLYRRRLGAVFGAAVLDRVLPRATRVRRAVAGTAALVGLALVVVALAEPRFDKQIQTVRATGVDLVLVLDLSRSMDARDVEPSRLERARREIADLFRVIQGDRVGLVVYAGGAWPRLPLTEDLQAVELVLSELDTSVFEAQGSALGDAIREGVALLARSDSPAGKALLVLSDGEIHEGDDALAAADEAAQAGVAIYAMGIGEEPAPIPVQGGWLAYNGEQVLTTPDDTVLREVARRTGGAYVKSVPSPADIVGLYEGEMRQKLKAVARDAQQREVWRSAFQWPLGAGLVLLLGGAWLGDGRRPFGAAAGWLLAVVVAAAPGSAAAGDLARADELYRAGRYAEAAEELTELSLERPSDARILERLGAARYRAGDFEGAARAWDTAARLAGGTDADDWYNAGNAHWRAGRLEAAAERYQEALARDPDHALARHNADLLAKELEARRNPPPPPPPKPDNAGEDEDTDDGGGEQDEDPTQGGQGEEQPQNPGEGEQEDPRSGSDDQQPPDGGGQSTPELSQVEEGEGEGQEELPEAVAGGEPSDMGEDRDMTAGQAERMLDAVEEGTQRVRIRGSRGSKPW